MRKEERRGERTEETLRDKRSTERYCHEICSLFSLQSAQLC